MHSRSISVLQPLEIVLCITASIRNLQKEQIEKRSIKIALNVLLIDDPGFVRSRKRRSSVHLAVLFVRRWLWCITCCSRANGRAVSADCNFRSSSRPSMADCHARAFGDPFFFRRVLRLRYGDKSEPAVDGAFVTRKCGEGMEKRWTREKGEKGKRKDREQKYRLKDIYGDPGPVLFSTDLPRYLRLRNGYRTNTVVATNPRYLPSRLSRFLTPILVAILA